ncbi:hypothetical protein BDM02DRAFT_3189524 [Thelephora ganbajun]|uniref:Uncharacterized protein n=1 Tax=Thelephora ganbajun TaxID=370292 RepID=A0ACB6Z7R6_THEGA|nr:hypothetical protein BDM02DRAFT_3189524 [Thelephora ganbajun]
MPPRQRITAIVHRIHTATQGTPQVQTSGIFKLPIELLFEIFSHLNDHRRYIRDTCTNGEQYGEVMRTKHVERSTVIRKLTMTCWPLRNVLLPVLWKNTEGCIVKPPSDGGPAGKTYGLYAQCAYLLSNPAIAVYVQALSVDLSFKDAPNDLMKKFIDTLVRLPNLRMLELLSVSHRSPVTTGLKRKCAHFPSIREMTVCSMYPDFIRSCPNLESLTFRRGFVLHSYATISSYGAGLKRVRGVDVGRSLNVDSVVRGCPKLQEIGLFGAVYCTSDEVVKHLREAKHLSVVEIHLAEYVEGRLDQSSNVLGRRKAWKACLIDVLKNSPSRDRKFLRWKVAKIYSQPDEKRLVREIVETEELEVLSDSSR